MSKIFSVMKVKCDFVNSTSQSGESYKVIANKAIQLSKIIGRECVLYSSGKILPRNSTNSSLVPHLIRRELYFDIGEHNNNQVSREDRTNTIGIYRFKDGNIFLDWNELEKFKRPLICLEGFYNRSRIVKSAFDDKSFKKTKIKALEIILKRASISFPEDSKLNFLEQQYRDNIEQLAKI